NDVERRSSESQVIAGISSTDEEEKMQVPRQSRIAEPGAALSSTASKNEYETTKDHRVLDLVMNDADVFEAKSTEAGGSEVMAQDEIEEAVKARFREETTEEKMHEVIAKVRADHVAGGHAGHATKSSTVGPAEC
ncbi:unnamed protein product, partial [Amoebophrya sp. A25]